MGAIALAGVLVGVALAGYVASHTPAAAPAA